MGILCLASREGRTPKGNGDKKASLEQCVLRLGAGRAERRKAMETRCHDLKADAPQHEPGGQNAERQWRRGAERFGLGDDVIEPGGQNAERQWRPRVWKLNLNTLSRSREGRTPKGNGDATGEKK